MTAWRVTNKTRDAVIYIRAEASRHSAQKVFFDNFIDYMHRWEHGHSYAFSRTPDLDQCNLKDWGHGVGVCFNEDQARRQGLIIRVNDNECAFCSKAAANRWIERKMGVSNDQAI